MNQEGRRERVIISMKLSANMHRKNLWKRVNWKSWSTPRRLFCRSGGRSGTKLLGPDEISGWTAWKSKTPICDLYLNGQLATTRKLDYDWLGRSTFWLVRLLERGDHMAGAASGLAQGIIAP
jgi:hypothetical protein